MGDGTTPSPLYNVWRKRIMVICGIDASTNKTGISIFKDGKYIEHTLIDLHKDKKIQTRLPKMMCEICSYLDKAQPDKIIMEKSVLKSNVATVQLLSMLSGAVLCYAAQHDIKFENPTPSAWRARVGLQQSNKVERTALKLEALQAVKQEYGLDVTDDEAESILLGRSGFELPKLNITTEDVDWDLVDTLN